MLSKSSRAFLAMILLLTLFNGFQFEESTVHAESKQSQNMERAALSYQSLQEYFYQEDASLYLEEYPNNTNKTYSYVWPFSQALAATIDMSGLPRKGGNYQDDVHNRLRGLKTYWNKDKMPNGYDSYVRPPFGQGGDIFYDDNEWIGLELVQLYRMNGNKNALSRAKEIFKLVVYGWDDNPAHPAPGGVFWTQAPWSSDRNTVSTGTGAELGFHLYEITGDQYYFKWANKMYKWTNEHMLAPNGLFWDHIDLEGEIEKTQWSYNQGVMIGTNTLLYRITNDDVYLKRAENIADAALNYYLEEERLYEQPARFNAIFFKNLLLLKNENHNNRYRKVMQTYADNVWEKIRDPQTGLFRFEGADPVTLLEQSAMVQIYATLAWKKKNYEDMS